MAQSVTNPTLDLSSGIFFFLDFIYLIERGTSRGTSRQRQRQREKQDSTEQGAQGSRDLEIMT